LNKKIVLFFTNRTTHFFDTAYHRIDDIAGNLGRKYSEIVGKNNKEDADTQTDTVFPKKMIECSKVFHRRKNRTKPPFRRS